MQLLMTYALDAFLGGSERWSVTIGEMPRRAPEERGSLRTVLMALVTTAVLASATSIAAPTSLLYHVGEGCKAKDSVAIFRDFAGYDAIFGPCHHEIPDQGDRVIIRCDRSKRLWVYLDSLGKCQVMQEMLDRDRAK